MLSPVSKNKPANFRLDFTAIGTQWHITTDKPLDGETKTYIQQRIIKFDNDYSRFIPDSWLRRVGDTIGTYDMPADAEPLFDIYKQLYTLTDGATTPLIGHMLAQAGYDEHYSLKPTTLMQLPAWDQALSYDFPKLTIKQPVVLDVGAAGKGYLVDIICDILLTAGYSECVVDAGGDIRVVNQSVQIGLESPFDSSEVIGLANVDNASLCGSAGNRRAWADFTHIINPHTLNSVTEIAAVWAIAANCLLADALTTALYFCPAQRLLQHYTFEYAIVYQDRSVVTSAGFPSLY